MIEKPDEMNPSAGMYLIMQLIAIAISATIVIPLFFLAGGMTIAINIPYSATPSALWIGCGRRSVATAPTTVPAVQQRTGSDSSPAIYIGVISPV